MYEEIIAALIIGKIVDNFHYRISTFIRILPEALIIQPQITFGHYVQGK